MRRVRKSPVEARDSITPSAVQQALPFAELTEARAPLVAAPTTLERLWFAIWLPQLPLEAVVTGPARDCDQRFTNRRAGSQSPADLVTQVPPLAVTEERHGVHRILQVDAAASAAGVTPGQSANSALALLPELVLEERSEVREQQVLEALATWCEQFSSFVHIDGRDVLLLEIAGSLRLFGGLPELRSKIARGLREQGFTASLAIAPTPLAATWLARAGQRRCIRALENLVPALRDISLAFLDWPEGTIEALQGVGVTTVGECLRLPREGFTRRFGAERLLALDRARGLLPDPRDSWRAPERFCRDFEMTEEQSDRELLLNICRELLLSHERFLLARQLGTQRLTFSFYHLKGAATQVQIGSALAERSCERWFELLRMRFERVQLPGPVIAVRLRSGLSQPLETTTAHLSLDRKPARRGFSIAQLAERLVARIGRQAVNAVTLVAEHRPEEAWRRLSPLSDWSSGVTGIDLRHRPLWMLPEPVLLPVDGGCPVHEGTRLTLLDGPERLETGWWDGDGISRDYYTAVTRSGMHLWVFRNRRQVPDWYLHGIFG